MKSPTQKRYREVSMRVEGGYLVVSARDDDE
jgi:hypothetical protein